MTEPLPTLYEIALACRQAQKRYFSDRSRENLIASKVAEKMLDAALEQLERAKS